MGHLTTRLVSVAALLLLFLPSDQAYAVVIDFETVPGVDAGGGEPFDEMQIDTHYLASAGVVFRLENGGAPRLARRGAPLTAFGGPGGDDGPDPSAAVGDWFLTDNSGTSGQEALPLLVEFLTPVSNVSGVILDVDIDDLWQVEIWGGGTLLDTDTITATDPDAGDGKATPFAFTRPSADIDLLRFVLLDDNGLLGFAIDNLSFDGSGNPPPDSSAPIDFEEVPGFGAPFDGMRISTQFSTTHGVTFELEQSDANDPPFPQIAMVGAPMTAFGGPPNHDSPDTPATSPDQGIGSFFLTDDGSISDITPPPLVIQYDPPTDKASGVVMDIDLTEIHTIEARDAQDVVIATITISDGDLNTGDGIATPWSFDLGAPVIHSIRLSGSRQKAGGFGLGFDLFDARDVPSSTPELSAVSAHQLVLAPNPATNWTRIDLGAGMADGPVSVSVFDARGRLVRTLGVRTGTNTGVIEWDTRSEAGHRVAPGVYYFRAKGSEAERTGRIVIRR